MQLKKISFIICTYNPDAERLQAVISCIAGQAVSDFCIELILVDNRSESPVLEYELDFGELDHKIVLEENPGLTAARISGYQNTCESASLVIFVDDDNLVAKDYASVVLHLSTIHSKVGVFSSGRILPQYEETPPKEIESYWPYLALIRLESSRWGNTVSTGVLPIGAGMAVRPSVMNSYIDAINSDPKRMQTDRDGSTLFAGGDTDIGLVAIQNGLGCGYFPEMELVHVMPSFRMKPQYLQKLTRDVSYSTTTVNCNAGALDVSGRLVLRFFCRSLLVSIFRLGASGTATRISARARFQAVFTFWWKSMFDAKN